MSTRDYAVSVLASLSEEKMMEFITLFADRSIIAKMESAKLAANPNPKLYNDFGEFMREMEEEEKMENENE